jgi:hypothetical protein
MRITTYIVEQFTRPIVAALYPRRHALKNRERLNGRLMLMELHAKGDDDAEVSTRTIPGRLESNGDRPIERRRSIADPAGPCCRRRSPIRCERGGRTPSYAASRTLTRASDGDANRGR